MGSFIRILSVTLPWVFIPLAAGALLFALYAFWQSLRAALGLVSTADVPGVVESETRRVLLEKKKAVLEGLADLKFERDAGKISDEDYERLDGELRIKAKRVMKLLDEDVRPFRREAVALIAERLSSTSRAPYRIKGVPLGGGDGDPIEAPAIFSDFEEVLREFFDGDGNAATAKSDAAKSNAAKSNAAEPDESAPSDVAKDAATKSCRACETENDLDAEFCKKCAAAFTVEAPETSEALSDGGEA